MTPFAPPPVISELHTMSTAQRVLRVLMLVGPIVSVLAAFAAAHDATWWILVPVLVLSLLCVVQPDSNLGLLVIVVVVLHWVAVVEDRRTVWTFVAAVGLCLFHTASAAATVTAPAARWTVAMGHRWVVRGGGVVAVTFVAWCVQMAMGGDEFGGNALLFAVALVVLTAAALVLRARAVSS